MSRKDYIDEFERIGMEMDNVNIEMPKRRKTVAIYFMENLLKEMAVEKEKKESEEFKERFDESMDALAMAKVILEQTPLSVWVDK